MSDSLGNEARESAGESRLTRRQLLAAGGTLTLALGGSSVLAACGSSSSGSAGASAGASGSDGSGSGEISSGLGSQLASILGVTQQDAKLASGKTWNLGSALPLTGAGAAYGVLQSSGIRLAIKHIGLAGGPKVNYLQMDHKSGVPPSLGVMIDRQFAAADVGAQLTSYIADLGAQIPSIATDKIMTFDPGGGVGAYPNKPFFWGPRALPPQQIFGGEFAFIAKTRPQLKKVFLLYPDEGAATTKSYFASFMPAIKQAGRTYAGSFKYQVGATDFSAAVRQLQGTDYDMIKLVGYGTDPGYFMKQYHAAGLTKQVLGSELTLDAAKIAGAGYDGLLVAFDYFDYTHPPNPLSKIFVQEFTKQYGAMKPDNYFTANYYESTLGLWELTRRVLRSGGDLNDGTALQAALEKEPVISSVYGGSASKVGTMTFDTKTHGLDSRSCSMLLNNNNKATLLATFNVTPPPEYGLKVISSS